MHCTGQISVLIKPTFAEWIAQADEIVQKPQKLETSPPANHLSGFPFTRATLTLEFP